MAGMVRSGVTHRKPQQSMNATPPCEPTVHDVVRAYVCAGTVWKAAQWLGITGDDLISRLKAIGHPVAWHDWSGEEMHQLRLMAEKKHTVVEIGSRLGRPLGEVVVRLVGVPECRITIESGSSEPELVKKKVAAIVEQADCGLFDLKTLAQVNDIPVGKLAYAMREFHPQWWEKYVSRRSLGQTTCHGCGRMFVPSRKDQKFHSGRCGSEFRMNDSYFCGNHDKAIGMADSICQLCGPVGRSLASHHALGKRADEAGLYLIALCNGCHQLVTILSSRTWVNNAETVSGLIALALLLRGKETVVTAEYHEI